MLEFLVFATIAAIGATLIWGKKFLPSINAAGGRIPAWSGKVAGVAAIIMAASAIWWLIPWGTTPPGKLVADNMSKEAHEMMVWLFGVSLIICTFWLSWKIFKSQSTTTKKPISGVWLVWILAIVTAGITAYSIAEMVVKSNKEVQQSQQLYRTVELVTKDSEVVEMMLTTVVAVSIPSVNISKEGDKRAWICADVVRPSKPPLKIEFESVNGGPANHHQVVISERSRQALFDYGILSVTVRFSRVIAKNADC